MKNIVLLLMSVSLFFSCNRKECKSSGPEEYIWEIPVTLFPSQDTFSIGDTITITSVFSNMVYDQVSGNKYKLVNYRFEPVTTLRKLDSQLLSPPSFHSSFKYADMKIITGQYRLTEYDKGASTYEGHYNSSRNEYKLKYQLIFKEAGLFMLNHYSQLEENVGNNFGAQTFVGHCSDWSRHAAINFNNGAENNLNMLNNLSSFPFIRGILKDPQNKFYKNGGYCFYVKE